MNSYEVDDNEVFHEVLKYLEEEIYDDRTGLFYKRSVEFFETLLKQYLQIKSGSCNDDPLYEHIRNLLENDPPYTIKNSIVKNEIATDLYCGMEALKSDLKEEAAEVPISFVDEIEMDMFDAGRLRSPSNFVLEPQQTVFLDMKMKFVIPSGYGLSVFSIDDDVIIHNPLFMPDHDGKIHLKFLMFNTKPSTMISISKGSQVATARLIKLTEMTKVDMDLT
jgi:hypothetical protein